MLSYCFNQIRLNVICSEGEIHNAKKNQNPGFDSVLFV